MNFIPVNIPSIGKEERDAILKCIDDGWVSSEGPFVKEFEDYLAEYMEVPYVVATTSGSISLLMALMAIDIGCEDEVIIPEPFYANYNGFAVAAGMNVVPVTAKIENGFALPPVAEIEQKITAKTKAIVICNPGNPTGYLYAKEMKC